MFYTNMVLNQMKRKPVNVNWVVTWVIFIGFTSGIPYI